ncbi:FadR/GntR family transcriptional regulator [Aureimonas ureilytica]|uniref:FadR/GntR family transcriptional regulator n=1 Tax=Aureimonas ureilytica TaxID=401562 RepID=UPI000379FD28|nr:FCD domain-containing protein [Aureimonas ureilytica]
MNQIAPVPRVGEETGGGRRRVRKGLLQRLVDEIVSGQFPEGGTLPNETELAERFQVSRTALREAMQHMGAQGLLRSRTRAGTIVMPQENWNYLDPQILEAALRYRTDDRFYLSLLDARRLLEPAAAALAAASADEEAREAIRVALDAMVEANDRDGEAWSRADLAFHTAIINASENWVYQQFVSAIRAALLSSFRLTNRASQSHEDAIRMHRDVWDAIDMRRPDAARGAMERLIDLARSEIADALRVARSDALVARADEAYS